MRPRKWGLSFLKKIVGGHAPRSLYVGGLVSRGDDQNRFILHQFTNELMLGGCTNPCYAWLVTHIPSNATLVVHDFMAI